MEAEETEAANTRQQAMIPDKKADRRTEKRLVSSSETGAVGVIYLRNGFRIAWAGNDVYAGH
jgi:hypothetical protein